ncbi:MULTISPECIES: hypothetical protein [unclassified Cupriavidus]|uniref:hypothetical protein n=1 Tax=unclassified Cupriavidus TaxID=2640874 RepID=UPI001C0016B9|nr:MULTISPECIES: hypothetical protein [unclassified Cupriavidus]MCA3187902.1 hypothetical protein [Cupriavidus sp.]MCA3189449.1 hypothetical protein [Cupriavidus sp.]MCA3195529.1 hypothetical protein [Cupriavidus sp.]MCA3201084.1 hypothetical protein [Cupriavidus sp.]MCA3207902.1 hypothetical protein [Cupriavidus sp.]
MDAIDRLLTDWHAWGCGWQPVAGYPRDAAFATAYHSTNQWATPEDIDDAIDRDLRERNARAIDPLIMALPLRERVAINVAVKNFAAGASVWTNPRWPNSQQADYAHAKQLLAPRLMALGLIGRDRVHVNA